MFSFDSVEQFGDWLRSLGVLQ